MLSDALDADWIIDSASAQFGDAPALEAGVAMNAQVQVKTDAGDTCQDVNFPIRAPGKDVGFYVSVNGLTRRDSATECG